MFTDAERDEVRRAVQDAEGATSGEIVPFVTPRSGRYAAAAWRAGAAGGLAGAAAILAARFAVGGWDVGWLHDPGFAHGVALAAAAAGFLAGRHWPPAVRLFAGSRTMAVAARRRALEAFVEEEVFATRDRTGILLFVSLLERRIEVVGDSGINARVDRREWTEVVTLVRDGIRTGRPAAGLVAAIGRCGRLLREKGVEIRSDDRNELSDKLRLGGRD